MDIKEKLSVVDSIKQKIDALGKLPDEVLKKINYRFRLDWNYYSNTMEGNTLTKEETRSIMIGNITVEGKPIKDVLEMKGHDETITNILKMGRGEMNVSEGRIKEIHKSIMNEEDPAKKPGVGRWKSVNNHIINYKNERYDFTDARDVHEEIHKLINWLTAENDKLIGGKKNAIHPAILAFQFHLRYLSIHPFYDGNGRTARIFMNIILIAHGFPPVVINTKEKTKYFQLLADIQAYGGSSDIYYNHMLDMLIRSLELVHTAAIGGDIEEPTDVDKELALLKQHLAKEDDIRFAKSNEAILTLWQSCFYNLFDSLHTRLKQFDELFMTKREGCYVNGGIGTNVGDEYNSSINRRFDAIIKLLEELAKPNENSTIERLKIQVRQDQLNNIEYQCAWEGFKKNKTNIFDMEASVHIRFDKMKYGVISIGVPGRAFNEVTKLYHEILTEEEMSRIVTAVFKRCLEFVKENMEGPKL